MAYDFNTTSDTMILHDVRNILACMQINIDRLRATAAPSQERTLERLDRAMTRAEEFTRHHYRDLRTRKKKLLPVYLDTAVHDVVEQIPQFVTRRQTVITGVPEEQAISTCPVALNRILFNLCLNASNAMDQTGAGRIMIYTEDFGDRVTVFVSDNGPGLPDHVVNQLLPTLLGDRNANQRMGLGLPTAIALTNALGGQFCLRQTGPAGTTFALDLPRQNRAVNMGRSGSPSRSQSNGL